MKKHATCILLLVIALTAITAFPFDLLAQPPAPDFTLTDLQGKSFKLRDHRMKTVLLIFGTTWCPSCRAEIPHFKQIFSTYAPRGLEIAYVNIEEPQDKVARFSAKYQLPYRTLLDTKGQVANAYEVMGVPAMVLIKDGRILTRNYRQIDGYLGKLLAK